MARDERWALAFGFQVSEFNLRFRISIPRKGAKGARVVISTEGRNLSQNPRIRLG